MGFFWSGKNNSVERIFKRSARYWGTTWMNNVLHGPRGDRHKSALPTSRRAWAMKLINYEKAHGWEPSYCPTDTGSSYKKKTTSSDANFKIVSNTFGSKEEFEAMATPRPRRASYVRSAATRSNGGLRGSSATRWK